MYTEKIKNYVGEDLFIYINKPKELKQYPTVILLHGFTSKGNNLTNKYLVEKLNSLNIATVCVDLSGHGSSGGTIADQTVTKAKFEIKAVVNWIIEQNWVDTSRISILGSSFSGNAAILFASESNILHSLALKSPVTNYFDVRLRQLGTERIEEWKRNGEIVLNDGTLSGYAFITDLSNFDSYEEIKKINCPVFVVQGDNDEDIPMEHTYKLKQALNADKDNIIIIHGASHGYSNRKHFDKMIDLFVEFFKKNLLEE